MEVLKRQNNLSSIEASMWFTKRTKIVSFLENRSIKIHNIMGFMIYRSRPNYAG